MSKLLTMAAFQVIVNVQGDEPFIPVENITQVADNLSSTTNRKTY